MGASGTGRRRNVDLRGKAWDAMRTLVIINPTAGSGKAAARWPSIAAQLTSATGRFDHVFTETPNHATMLASRAAREGMERIIAVGGDGTANEVTNGILACRDTGAALPRLGVIPCGTGSDFCRSLGLKPDPAAAVARIASGATRLIDVGIAQYTRISGVVASRHFINIATFGLSGQISCNLNNRAKVSALPGPVRYLTETLRALASYRPPRMRITIDGKAIERGVYFAAVANAKYFGGGMHIAPAALLDDGLFDIVILDAISKWQLVRKIGKVYRGAHLNEPEITVLRGSHVIAETVIGEDAAMGLLDLDGEHSGMLRAEFRVLPKALRLSM